MKQLKKLLFRCLLFFYLSSSYLSATHFHNKSVNTNTDCKICILIENLNGGDIPRTQIDFVSNIDYAKISIKINEFHKTVLKGFNSNAPPKLS